MRTSLSWGALVFMTELEKIVAEIKEKQEKG